MELSEVAIILILMNQHQHTTPTAQSPRNTLEHIVLEDLPKEEKLVGLIRKQKENESRCQKYDMSFQHFFTKTGATI